MPASSFGAVNIRVELDPGDASSPDWERPVYATTRHLPGGNDDVTQVMGLGSAVVTHRLFLDAAEWAALRALLGTEATLTLAGVSQGTCLLEALGAPVRHVDGWVTAAATFRQAAAP